MSKFVGMKNIFLSSINARRQKEQFDKISYWFYLNEKSTKNIEEKPKNPMMFFCFAELLSLDRNIHLMIERLSIVETDKSRRYLIESNNNIWSFVKVFFFAALKIVLEREIYVYKHIPNGERE